MQNNEQFFRQISHFDDGTVRALESSGLRLTIQRRLIIEILFQRQYYTPKEVWCEARKSIPDLGIATVYRLINRLEQIGVLAKTRNLGMAQFNPKLGLVLDSRGKTIPIKSKITLEDIIRNGMVSYGLIQANSTISLNLVGDKINISVVQHHVV